jgi:phosphatidylglycerol:prolipoprotein diacylglycerol transferase
LKGGQNLNNIVNDIEFPNLFRGVLHIPRVAATVFGLQIYWYGVLITVGVVLGLLYALKHAKSFGIKEDHVLDVTFAGLIGGVIGARAYYVLFNLDDYTLKTAIFGIRDGGLAIYGGVIGGLLAAFIYVKIKRLRFLPFLDLGGICVPIGQSIGRWGNFVNQEAYGVPTASRLPWGMTGNIIREDMKITGTNGELPLVHPCFLYESLWCLLGFAVLHFCSKKRHFDGEIFLMYVAWYGGGRTVIEGLRTDSLYIGSFRVSQVLALVSCVISVFLLVVLRIREKVLYCGKRDARTDEFQFNQIDKEKKDAVAAFKKTAYFKKIKSNKKE